MTSSRPSLRSADAWNRHDMVALAGLFEDEARFVNVVGMFWRSREEIRQAHAFSHESMFKDSALTVKAVEDTALAPGVVAVHVHWHLEGHLGPTGEPEQPRDGVLLLVARETEQWRLADRRGAEYRRYSRCRDHPAEVIAEACRSLRTG
ncbi:MAG: SgcJ/EcaC family oxidoreductase [Geminicoccaceae bacterium]